MRKQILSILMAMIIILGIVPIQSFADEKKLEVDAQLLSGSGEGQTDAMVMAKIKNISGNVLNSIEVTLDTVDLFSGDKGISPSRTQIIDTLKSNEEKPVSWKIDITGAVIDKSYSLSVITKVNGSQDASDTTTLRIEPLVDENKGKPNLPPPSDNQSTYNIQPKLQVVAPSGGYNSGATTSIQLNITNPGNAKFSNVVASITPGDKITLKNASVEQQVGSIERSASATANFPIYIDPTHPGGNVPITFSVKGTDPAGKEITASITEYITINAGVSQIDRLEIINIQNPQSVNMDQTFSLKFAVRNNGSQTAKNIKVSVEPTAPLVNKSKNIYIVSLGAGESKAFDIQMFVVGNAEVQSQNYPIKITAETSDKEPSSITQYAGVFVNGDNKTKTVPQLIITNYTYGGEAAVANEVFPLSMVLKNTNASQTLKNIKISLTAEEGVFIPHNTSNSFYIEKIGPNGSVNKTIELMTKPDAAEKTSSITVDMSYEDSKGNPVTVKDIISVPVVQQRKIVVDDVNPLGPIFAGEDSTISVQYYNMGKSTLNNLIINAEAEKINFTQSPKTFIGKFDPGKSGSYDFYFIADSPGEISGKILISFEDSNGKEIKMEKPFKFNVEKPVPTTDPGMEGDNPEIKPPSKSKYLFIGGGILAFLVLLVLIIKKVRKKKFDDSLDIGNE